MAAQADFLSETTRYIVDDGFLAEVFSVTTRQVRNYVKQGMPQAARNTYDVRQCVQWMLDQKQPAKATTEVTARSRLAEAQRERVELEIQEKRGELIQAGIVASMFHKIATLLATQHDGFGARNAAMLADENEPGAIQRVLFTEMRQIRRNIADEFDKFADEIGIETEKPAPKKTTKKRTSRKKPAQADAAV